ncbi:hypothetical protein DSCO28_58870 [Desulfosarcina ovata subsp. sediminis]|uniref:Uncharacterized protein n=1 Tax=Desulfosarcina ovata subsp. sediminis TaxID=885957 RepID=A0A5K7ZYX0_9BACT|nr:hypothetical protein DSCO28_58870 [Desulfosarcina ovata subsp. sediminis]
MFAEQLSEAIFPYEQRRDDHAGKDRTKCHIANLKSHIWYLKSFVLLVKRKNDGIVKLSTKKKDFKE